LVAENILEKKETENKNEVHSERATTPEQSPSTKAKLRKVCLSIVVYPYAINNQIKNLIHINCICFKNISYFYKLKKYFFHYYDTIIYNEDYKVNLGNLYQNCSYLIKIILTKQ